jgi:hypothetical protein
MAVEAVVPAASRITRDDDMVATSSHDESVAATVKEEGTEPEAAAGCAKRGRSRPRRRREPAGTDRGGVPGALPRHARARPPRRRPRVLRLRQGVRVPPGARRPQGQPPEAAASRSGSTGGRACGGRAEAAGDGPVGARVPRVREDVPDGAGAGRAQALPLRRHHRQRRLWEEQGRRRRPRRAGRLDRPEPAGGAVHGRGGRGAQPDGVEEAQAHGPGLIPVISLAPFIDLFCTVNYFSDRMVHLRTR